MLYFRKAEDARISNMTFLSWWRRQGQGRHGGQGRQGGQGQQGRQGGQHMLYFWKAEDARISNMTFLSWWQGRQGGQGGQGGHFGHFSTLFKLFQTFPHLVNFLPHLVTLMSDSFFTLRGITSAHCTYKGFDLFCFFFEGRALQKKLLVNQIWPWFPFPLKLAAVQVVEDLRILPPIILTSAPVSHTTGGSRWLRRVASLLSAAHFLFLFTAISSRRPAAQISTVRKICKADSMNLR